MAWFWWLVFLQESQRRNSLNQYNNFTIKTELKPTTKSVNTVSSIKSPNIPPENYPEFKTTDSGTDHQRVSAYLLFLLRSPLRNGMELHGAKIPERQAKGDFCLLSGVECNGAMGCEIKFLMYQCWERRHMKCLYGCSALAGHSKHFMPSPSRQQETTPMFLGGYFA